MAATLKEAKKLIEALDLTPMIERVMKEKRWTRRMADVAAGFYRNFLYLSKKYPEESLSPTRQIDEIWHAHILYTQDYHRACEKIFGFYLHHQPTHEDNSSSNESDDIEFLQQLHEQEFGASIYDAVYSVKDLFWSISTKFKKNKN